MLYATYIYISIVCVILTHVKEIVIDFHPVSDKPSGKEMALLLLAGLLCSISGHIVEDPETAAIGDEISPAYYRKDSISEPVIILGEPLRVRETEEARSALGPAFMFKGKYMAGDWEDIKDEEGNAERYSSLNTPPPGLNVQEAGQLEPRSFNNAFLFRCLKQL